jgi:LysM repeat protein
MLKQKYQPVLDLAAKLGIGGLEVKEEGGKVNVKGTAPYQLEKDKLWDTLKAIPGWENEVSADIRVQSTEVYGYYTVKPGDSLSKIAKDVYDNGTRYMEIFKANTDKLTNPDMIKVGQVLTIPKR